MKTLMKNSLKFWMMILFGAFMTTAWTGCEDAGDEMEDAGEEVEDAAESAGDTVEDAADDVTDEY